MVSMIGSELFAGVNAKPDDLGDFVVSRTIGNFSVTGTLADSVVAAAHFNSITLANVDKSAGSEVNGIYADAIKSYVRKGVDPVRLTRLDAPDEVDEELNYEVVLF